MPFRKNNLIRCLNKSSDANNIINIMSDSAVSWYIILISTAEAQVKSMQTFKSIKNLTGYTR